MIEIEYTNNTVNCNKHHRQCYILFLCPDRGMTRGMTSGTLMFLVCTSQTIIHGLQCQHDVDVHLRFSLDIALHLTIPRVTFNMDII